MAVKPCTRRRSVNSRIFDQEASGSLHGDDSGEAGLLLGPRFPVGPTKPASLARGGTSSATRSSMMGRLEGLGFRSHALAGGVGKGCPATVVMAYPYRSLVERIDGAGEGSETAGQS